MTVEKTDQGLIVDGQPVTEEVLIDLAQPRSAVSLPEMVTATLVQAGLATRDFRGLCTGTDELRSTLIEQYGKKVAKRWQS